MAKKILCVAPSHVGDRWRDLLERNGYKCEYVHQEDDAIKKIGQHDYDGVYILNLNLSRRAMLNGGSFEGGMHVLRVARERGLPCLVSHSITEGETAEEVKSLAAEMVQIPSFPNEILAKVRKVFT